MVIDTHFIDFILAFQNFEIYRVIHAINKEVMR